MILRAILQKIEGWCYARRLRAARRRMDSLGPATDEEWFVDKSLAYFISQGTDPKAKYADQHLKNLRVRIKPSSKMVEYGGVLYYFSQERWNKCLTSPSVELAFIQECRKIDMGLGI